MLDGNVLLRQECDEVPKGTLSCPDRIMEFFYQLRHYEGAHLLLSVCCRKLIQQTLIRLRAYLPIWHLQLESRGPSAHYRLYVWQKLEVDLWQLILPFYNKGKQKLVYSIYF